MYLPPAQNPVRPIFAASTSGRALRAATEDLATDSTSGSPARYETRVGDNHHHVICRNCGRMADVDCAVGSAPCLTPVDAAGFQIDEAEVVYWGRCPDCVSRALEGQQPRSTDAPASAPAENRR